MSEWTIRVETPEGATSDEDALLRFSDSLQEHPDALGAAAMMNVRAGTLSATFQVDAPTQDEAALKGCFAYWRAIADAHVDLRGEHSTLEIAPTAEDGSDAAPAERFQFRYVFERERRVA